MLQTSYGTELTLFSLILDPDCGKRLWYFVAMDIILARGKVVNVVSLVVILVIYLLTFKHVYLPASQVL